MNEIRELAPGLRMRRGYYELLCNGDWRLASELCDMIGIERVSLIKRIRKYRAGKLHLQQVFSPPNGNQARQTPEREQCLISVPLGRESKHKISPLWRRALCSPWGRVNTHPQL